MSGTTQRYFISYAGVDRSWAEWVGYRLDKAGHRVTLDVWDWRTGDDFVQRMDEGLVQADAVVALFSKSYFEPGRWTGEEWSAVIARRDRIIPLAIEPLTNRDIPPIRRHPGPHGPPRAGRRGRAVAARWTAVGGSVRPSSRRSRAGPRRAAPVEQPAAVPGDRRGCDSGGRAWRSRTSRRPGRPEPAEGRDGLRSRLRRAA
ncbi:hypothetical protein SGLAM104S_00123 [Streptomyces glaucescens]